MMQSLRDIPIKRKLTIITMGTTCLALLLAAIAFGVHDRITFRKTLVQNLSITAEMTGNNVASALSFDDAASARDTLASLVAEPRVTAAAVYNSAGQVFAVYTRRDVNGFVPPAFEPGHLYTNNSFGMSRQILAGGELVGGIYVESDLTEMQERAVQYAIIVVVVVVLISGLTFYISSRLHRLISEPVSELAAVAGRVAGERNYALRATRMGQDELGQLIDVFNEMLGQIQARDHALEEARHGLEKRVSERTEDLRQTCEKLVEEINERKEAENRLAAAHKELVIASHFAGMAEVATGVLHNVGNVLNSVNVSASIVMERVNGSKVANLEKVSTLLAERDGVLPEFFQNDPRGKQLPSYLRKLTVHLANERAQICKELQGLQKNIDHIKTIVAMQQNYAKTSGLIETVSVVELVEDAIRMNAGALERHRVDLVREYNDVPAVKLDRHKFLQILVNLIRNAKYACDESEKEERRLTLRIVRDTFWIIISVIDNGVGIPPENMTSIFNHGFTTRADGHGFGLHSGALAAKEMGGSLAAESAGHGEGATFILRVPIHNQNSEEAALN